MRRNRTGGILEFQGKRWRIIRKFRSDAVYGAIIAAVGDATEHSYIIEENDAGSDYDEG